MSRIKPTLNPESGSVYQWTNELEFSGTSEKTVGVTLEGTAGRELRIPSPVAGISGLGIGERGSA